MLEVRYKKINKNTDIPQEVSSRIRSKEADFACLAKIQEGLRQNNFPEKETNQVINIYSSYTLSLKIANERPNFAPIAPKKTNSATRIPISSITLGP